MAKFARMQTLSWAQKLRNKIELTKNEKGDSDARIQRSELGGLDNPVFKKS